MESLEEGLETCHALEDEGKVHYHLRGNLRVDNSRNGGIV